MADVRISTHTARTQNHRFVIIRFYEGLENLIGSNYVFLNVDGGRLYFGPSELKVKGALKLSQYVNVWKQVDLIAPFEGEYSIEYDNLKGLYYVDKSDSSEISRRYGNHNVCHPNYKSHAYEPYVEKSDETVNEIEVVPTMTSVKTRKYSMTVYDGLLELLRIQIDDLNKSGVNATLNTIKSLIEDE